MAKEDRPDVQIFMALLDSNLWRPSDSGRRVALDWLHYIARNSFAQSRMSGVRERRESFRAALALEDTDSPRHPSQVRTKDHLYSGLGSNMSDTWGRSITKVFLRRVFKQYEVGGPVLREACPVELQNASGSASYSAWLFDLPGPSRSTPQISIRFSIVARQSAGTSDVRHHAAE